jgi:hypothetical protein
MKKGGQEARSNIYGTLTSLFFLHFSVKREQCSIEFFLHYFLLIRKGIHIICGLCNCMRGLTTNYWNFVHLCVAKF